MGRVSDALECRASAVNTQKSLIELSSDRAGERKRLIDLLIDQADMLVADRKTADVERVLAQARDVAERLRNDFPSVARYHDVGASALVKLAGVVRTDRRRLAEAQTSSIARVD